MLKIKADTKITTMKKTVLALTVVLAILVVNNGGVLFINDADASSVTVSASVTQTVTCNTVATSTSFGTLTSGAVATATPNATTSVATNDPIGMTLTVVDSNAGLATTSPAYTIHSTTATLAAGTEGYGIQATSTAGITVAAVFNKTGNDVGALATTTQTLASSSATISSSVVTVTHLAAISGTTPAGSYTDSITYSCTGN
jgi:hypothetical protein